MENASDALNIAFAIFVFVIAITIIFSVITQAKSTSDYVLFHSDKTNFYNHASSNDQYEVVGVAEVISTLYRYYKESIAVTVVLDPESKNERTFDLSENSYLDVGSIEKDLGQYIENCLLSGAVDKNFKEEFVEVPISGIYEVGEDGSEIIRASGLKKVYVTYTILP